MITIFIGTETGTAEYVADEINELLTQHGHETTLIDDLRTAQLDTQTPQTWVICTSTHGAGEIPDNLKSIHEKIINASDLSHIKHLVIGLGDSSYDTYCKAAKDLSEALINTKSEPLSSPILVDAMSDELPEDLIIPQLNTMLDKF